MDDARSSEITINILSNAVKYTGEGGNISCTLNQYPGEKEGWSVLELIIADNGVACIDMFNKAKQNYYSLILMDIQMLIMNGYEASRRIRELKDGNKSQIPIVAMTANAFEEDNKMAFASGMNDHVAKPIDMNVLLPTIMKYM